VSPYAKAALSAIRLIAAGFIILSLVWYCPDLLSWLAHHPLHHRAMLVLKAAPFVAGVLLFWKSDDIAKWLTKDLD
jgi:hypothetical protein